MSKEAVIKHSSAIQISNTVDLLQRRAWNVMLAEAFDKLAHQETYTLPLRDLRATLGYSSHNDEHLKSLLKDLVSTTVEWDILGKDGREWGASGLLAEVKIINGTVHYAYGPTIREKLHNPHMYARISLSLQNQFTSKHALALYELSLDYFNSKTGAGETPWIALVDLRKLLGIKEEEYRRPKDLLNYAVKKPLEEINKKSDLRVSVEYEREKRRVVAVKFRVKANAKNQLLVARRPPEAEQGTLPLAELEIENQGLLQILTQDFGVSQRAAIEFLKTKDEYEIYEVLDYVRAQISAGKVKNIPAYTVKAIEGNYRLHKPAYSASSKRRPRSSKTRQEQERIQELLKEFTASQDTKVHGIIRNLKDGKDPELLDRFEKAEIQGESWIRDQYRSVGICGTVERVLEGYIRAHILNEKDRDFVAYAKAQGVGVVETGQGGYTLDKKEAA